MTTIVAALFVGVESIQGFLHSK